MSHSISKKLFLSVCCIFSIALSSPATFSDTTPPPQDLAAAVLSLKQILSSSDLEKLKNSGKNVVLDFQSANAGLFIRNNWLRGDSKLKTYLSQLGLWDIDDMSYMIIEALRKNLRSEAFDVNSEIKALSMAHRYSTYRNVENKSVSSELANFLFATDTNTKAKLSDFKGKVIVICLFWRDDDSERSLDILNKMCRKFPKKELRVFAVPNDTLSLDDSAAIIEKHQGPINFITDRAFLYWLRRELIVGGIALPTTVVIGKDFVMRTRLNAWDKQSENMLISAISNAVAEGGKK